MNGTETYGTILNGEIEAYCNECDLYRIFRTIITTTSCNITCGHCHKRYFYRIVKNKGDWQ